MRSTTSAYRSLRVRLPLMICALLTVVVTIFLWAAYTEVKTILVLTGEVRAQGAADQVASLLTTSTQSGLTALVKVAGDVRVRRYVQHPTPAAIDGVRNALRPLLTSSSQQHVELWNATATRVFIISYPSTVVTGALAEKHAPKSPPSVGLNPLEHIGHTVYTDSVVMIPAAGPSSAPSRTGGGVAGYLVLRSTLAANPPGILNRLVGSNSVIEIGNVAGGTWTDLSRIVAAPPVDLSHKSVVTYHDSHGDWRIGAVSMITGTPWAVWVEFPQSLIVAPAQTYLGQMMILALIVVAFGGFLAALFSVRITRPLHELAAAADGIASGDYARRVQTNRSDEIGRLGVAFNAMASDVKRALDALGESEAHYRTIFEAAIDCIVTTDGNGRVTEFNPAAEKTFGYAKSDTLGRELVDLIVPPSKRELRRSAFTHFTRTGETGYAERRFEITAMRSDGTEFPIELALSAAGSGESLEVTAVARDITERKNMEAIRLQVQEMEEHTARTIEANRLKSKFLANMSHELRTPLNAIIGFTELIHGGMTGPVSAEQKEFLGDILASSKHLLQLINDVLDLSKVESGRMDFRPEYVDVEALVNEVRDALRILAADQGLALRTDVDPLVKSVVIDRGRLKQILLNYMSNAIKFTPAGGSVRVAVSPDGLDKFRIDVTDTGVGIPRQDIDKLFTEFRQLDSGGGKRHQGTGLGLALVKRLAEAQGGSIAVVSTVGIGSTFSAVLPRHAFASPSADTAVLAGTAGSGPVLIVDDDPATLKMADVVVRDVGHTTICKQDAEGALRAAATTVPSLVIVDVIMPVIDGFQFISRFRQMPGCGDVPVLVWTVKDLDIEERVRLKGWGATIIPKRGGGAQALIEALRRLGTPRPLTLDGTHGG